MIQSKYDNLLIILLVFILVFTSSCGLAQVEGSEADSDKTMPTGYSDGGIGFASIYYDGQLFRLEETVGEFTEEELPAKLQALGAKEVGTIVTETNHRWPSLDLEASRLPASLSVYYDPAQKRLYVVTEEGALRLLEPYLEPLYELEVNK